MSAITEGVALLDVVTHLATPIAHFTIIFAPSMHGVVANGNLSLVSSFALEVGGLVHIVVDATTYAGNGVGGGKAFGTSVHG